MSINLADRIFEDLRLQNKFAAACMGIGAEATLAAPAPEPHAAPVPHRRVPVAVLQVAGHVLCVFSDGTAIRDNAELDQWWFLLPRMPQGDA